jgi:hypothetical protein
VDSEGPPPGAREAPSRRTLPRLMGGPSTGRAAADARGPAGCQRAGMRESLAPTWHNHTVQWDHRLCPQCAPRQYPSAHTGPRFLGTFLQMKETSFPLAFGTLLSRSAKAVSKDLAAAEGAVSPTFNMAK